jgi:hypothetical protein
MEHGAPAVADTSDARLRDLTLQMLHDPVIRARVMADSVLRRRLVESRSSMPPDHREMIDELLRADSLAARDRGTRRTPKRNPRPPRAPDKPERTASMPGMDHAKMAKPAKKPPVHP